jgi:hypothetical protein
MLEYPFAGGATEEGMMADKPIWSVFKVIKAKDTGATRRVRLARD